MIRANELRIGNWYNNGYANYKLGTSDFMDYLNEAQVNGGIIENIFPIPLTYDVLNKCDLNKDNFYHGRNIVRFSKKPYNDWIYLHYYKEENYLRLTRIGTLCYYLHQFQNLYYQLTYTELEVNLETVSS